VSESIKQVVAENVDEPLFATTWIEVVKPNKETFRGVDANQKILAALFHEGSQNRFVVDDQFTSKLHDLISTSLLMFSTPFGVVWFFGGMFLIFFHQSRVYRRKYGSEYRLSIKT
jgi:hypothetical protein